MKAQLNSEMNAGGLVPKSRRTEAGDGPRRGGSQSLALGRHSMPLVPYGFFFSFFQAATFCADKH